MSEIAQKAELAAFLRARREAIDPASVGLNVGTRRRTPGLRREDVAQLSGVSHTWYTWLEQGRDIGVSRQVLDRLAKALRLQPSERSHLFTLAGLLLPPEQDELPEVSVVLRRLVDTLDPNPAYVVTPWWDLLAYNSAYGVLIDSANTLLTAKRNIVWLMFTEPSMRQLFEDWQAEAQQLVGQLRVHLAQYPQDPRGPDLVGRLNEASPVFAELWREHAINQFRTARKRLRHPQVGALALDYTKLIVAESEQQHVIVFLPADAQTKAGLDDLVRSAAAP